MFIGRERELKKLYTLYHSGQFEFAVFYGRRRVGKTTLINEFIKDNVSVEGLIHILEKYKDQDIEIMSHCGECDLELYLKSSYALPRVQELAVLCDPAIKDYIQKNKIIITNYLDEEVNQ